jgi:protein-arginine kinase
MTETHVTEALIAEHTIALLYLHNMNMGKGAGITFGFVFHLQATKISRFWPKHRYLTCSHDNKVQVCMNVEDHLDILVSSKYGKLYPMLQTLNNTYTSFKEKFKFYENEQFGFLTVDPYRAGTGMKV